MGKQTYLHPLGEMVEGLLGPRVFLTFDLGAFHSSPAATFKVTQHSLRMSRTVLSSPGLTTVTLGCLDFLAVKPHSLCVLTLPFNVSF